MSYPTPLFSINKPCDEAVAMATQKLMAANLQVVRTFDLQVARTPYAAQGSCSCPNHGTERCDCQMVILLVYREGQKPISLVAHGHNGHTWFDLVDSPEQPADPRSQAIIHQTLIQQDT